MSRIIAKPAPAAPKRTVFLLDVDNTLLDNDRVTADLRAHLAAELGPAARDHYFELFEGLRRELGYADYLGTLQRYRSERPHTQCLLTVSGFLIDYPFRDRLFPGAFAVVTHLQTLGPTVILSDGDVVFQPHKIRRSGLYSAFDGEVLIYIHKEGELAEVEHLYPAAHYVMVDDKLRLLSAMKDVWGERLTTVFVRQGHYAFDPKATEPYPAADLTIDSLAELLEFGLEDFALTL